ncbi:hypothetical protein [uncultured Aquimarina sp.]|uniref:hypothetical protein n=1 Tax=uncultured Aquimarina sp. TaxID=575652 RepID=UPI002603B0DB|nr:hypothetical protein [uncultured Aquimarina sp.]
MKKNTPFIILLLLSALGFSQSFNYQSVVRNATGDLVINQSIGVQVQILEGAAPDLVVYTETHTVTSSVQGIISLPIGSGTTSDTFDTINWSQQNQWIGIAVDITGGTTYTSIGTNKLQQVPYALYAANSGDKAFTTIANVTSNSPGDITTDDFVFGSTQLADDATTFDDNIRLFFDKSKGAFRAGYAQDDQWDDVNVGPRSIAFGNQNVASGFQSFIMGAHNTVSGPTSTSFGVNNNITGVGTFSTGESLTAEARSQVTIGYFNTAEAGNPFIKVPTDRLFVIGNGLDEMSRSDALVMLKNGNTTLNGSLTIDGDNQGAGTSYTLPAQDGAANQIMSTDGSGNVSWTAASEAFSTTSNVTSNANGTIATDDFVFGSTQLNNDPMTTDDNAKMFFDKSKAAFRVGRLRDLDPDDPEDNEHGDQWDDVNVGEESIVLGNSTAAGSNAIAIGNLNNLSVTARESIAIGSGNTITQGNGYAFGQGHTIDYSGSTAIGLSNTSSGFGATAIGFVTHAGSYSEIAIGLNNTVVNGAKDFYQSTDRLFVIGNGISSIQRRDALVMLKNGNTTLNGQLTIDGDNQGAGTSYTLPAQDGTANQIMTTDGSGNVSWIANNGLPSGGTNGQLLGVSGIGIQWLDADEVILDDSPTNEIELPSGGTSGQVLQTDGAGNYSWTNNTEAPGAFTALTLNAAEGWEYYNAAFSVTNFQNPRYRKVSNIVYLEGMCRKNAAINNADTVMTLPVGFRPTKTRIFSVETENGSIRVDVNANGTVLVATGFNVNQNWISLDGITFSVD